MASSVVKRHNETVLRDLEEGDMVEFPRGVYSHWGVYIGNFISFHFREFFLNSNFRFFSPLLHLPILGSSNSAENKDMMSKILTNGDTII